MKRAAQGRCEGLGGLAGEGTASGLPGFWLPRSVRDQVLSPETEWQSVAFSQGRECGSECPPDEPGRATAQWPLLDAEEWQRLLQALSENRARAPQGPELWNRLERALRRAAGRGFKGGDGTGEDLLAALSAYTGYSRLLIEFALRSPSLWDAGVLAQTFGLSPSWEAAEDWVSLGGIPGRMRFFPASRLARAWSRTGVPGRRPLFGAEEPLELMLGFAAGNVPGTALLLVLLALATTVSGDGPPVVLVRNSRREPLFSPLVLSLLEEEDEEVVSTVALLVWDYDEPLVQRPLLSRADAVLAAAGNDTIAQISRDMSLSGARARFHAHGHKVSFTAVSREGLGDDRVIGAADVEPMDALALLTALDSVMWDQNGCLSSRFHFVERWGSEDPGPLAYAEALTRQMRELARRLPRGCWPRGRLHDTFDRYKAMEIRGDVHVLSAHGDEFVVVLDARPAVRGEAAARTFAGAVNECQGRVVVVRPVDDLLEVPERYLRYLPAHMLQSLSVAIGTADRPLGERFLAFASACGDAGITAIRPAGRAAFPQLAYSWDGFLPLDLVRRRPTGHFTTIEFDDCGRAMERTYQEFRGLLGAG